MPNIPKLKNSQPRQVVGKDSSKFLLTKNDFPPGYNQHKKTTICRLTPKKKTQMTLQNLLLRTLITVPNRLCKNGNTPLVNHKFKSKKNFVTQCCHLYFS